MATFDNPSYFTISGATSPQVDHVTHKSSSKRFRSWFKLKRPFRAKDPVDENRNPSSPEANPVPESQEQPPVTRNSTSSANDFAKSDVIYYNFTSATLEPAGDEDDVFSDTSTVREHVGSTIGSTRTLNRRRHSLGSWFRSSLAVVRKTAPSAASTASGLEAAAAAERPSTSSERQLLPRAVSSSTNCVSYRSSRDVRTCESTGLAASSTSCNANGPSSTNNQGRKSRSKLPVAVKSHVELRARARFARQEKLFGEAKASASTSRIPRPVKSPHTTASLDRRYTNSTEVLASASSNKSEDNPLASSAASSAGIFKMEADNQKRSGLEDREENRPEGDDLFQVEDSRTRGRGRAQLHRSRTVEERSRSCCSRINISSRAERRRASLDVSSHSSHSVARRRCQRCREKVELSPSDRFDVVIIFSRNCTIASPWISYLSNVIQSIFRSSDRPTTSVTSRDVESIVNCNSFGEGTFERGASSYANQSTVEQVDNERWKRRQVFRKTVSSALLQIVLVSRPLLQHIGANANDPLGKLLHPKRVIGLMLGVDESSDINELHTSALYTFKYWPRITMADQDLASIDRFIKLSASILQRSLPAYQPKVARFKLTPKKLRPGENKVTLLLLETREDIGHQAEVLVDSEEVAGDPIRITKLAWINPYCASFLVPDKFLERDIIIRVGLNVGGLSWGSRELKCQNKLGELSILLHKNYLVGNPLDLMCQAMKISPLDHKRLDEELAKNLIRQKVMGHLFRPADDAPRMERGGEFPTVLHFAARFGFVELTWHLLECPGAVDALKIRNVDGHDVVALAELHGQDEIIRNIESVLEVFTHSDNDDEENVAEDMYVDICPAVYEKDVSRAHYDVLPPPRPVITTEEPPSAGASRETTYLPLCPEPHNSSEPAEERVHMPSDSEAAKASTSNENQPQTCMDELLYMMTMFKDGQINIRQLEIFFEEWKGRKDVVNDTAEKKAILQHMKVILQKKKVEEKKNTVWVLNRMKSVLRLRTAKEDAASDATAGCSVVTPIPILPARDLNGRGRSPQSSWSSDRSSAASRLSHDSGTHSDSTEEKKASQTNPSTHEYDTPPPTEGALKTCNDYAIPPHPRLVTEPTGSPSLPPRKQSAGSIGGSCRPIFPLPRPPLKQDYLEEIFVNPSEYDRKVTIGHPKVLATMPVFEEMDVVVQLPIRPPQPTPKPQLVVDSFESPAAFETQHSQERESSAESFYMDMSSGVNSPKRSGSPRHENMSNAYLNYPPQDEDDYVTGEEINVPGPYPSSNSLNEGKRSPAAHRQFSIGSRPVLQCSRSSHLSFSAPDITSPTPPLLPPRKFSGGGLKPQPLPRTKSPTLPTRRE